MKFWTIVRTVACCVLAAGGVAYAQETGGQSFEPPQLANRTELLAAFRKHYHVQLRRQGIGGTAQVRLFVDTSGAADSVRLTKEIGIPELDEAAVSIARAMKFTPAKVGGEPRALWLDLPITLLPPQRADPPSGNKIKLVNRSDIVQSLHANLPTEALEAERVALQADLWIEIDAEGNVVDIDFERSSCVEDTDKLAYYLAHAFRFEPAEGYEGPINGWTVVTLTFDPALTNEQSVELEREAELRRVREMADRQSRYAERRVVVAEPEIINDKEIESLVKAGYPEELAKEGVGGTTEVKLWLDHNGVPLKRMITKSSKNCLLDLFALEVTGAARFTPLLENGVPKPTTVTYPVRFRPSN